MLHIVKHHQALAQALAYVDAEDPILLVEDGVYAALAEHASHIALTQNANPFYVLDADVKARGLEKLPLNHVELIDFSGFVVLTEDNETSMTW
ncbi:sulfurtransferase complex subunit TusB [Vibrio albus]|jgi:tRNA 2-thiouridine synthesizing protein B|uniref:Sulfurtransferase complex subunit TusB n=1 Tax=Vibrio albus TaxID=2200953 RepID=A0A2U3BA72_9VIBR|nr:sulfurtransferase complex subunit TusB [Vibrio albus]PWI33677.1 sulfurtransferase complex subunit TusB [Vibrio albus]